MGVFDVPEDAGRVVGSPTRPEVGAPYENAADALPGVPERVVDELFGCDGRVAGVKEWRLRESGALSDDAFGSCRRWRKKRKSARRRQLERNRGVHLGFITSLGGT